MRRVDHAEASSKFIEAKDHAGFHDMRLWDLRQKRDRESEDIPEWQELRALASAITGSTRVKCSIIVPRIAGFRCFQSPSRLVTEMKSDPKKTRLTSGMANSALARGERPAASTLGKSATAPSPITSRPGRKFRVAGLGVDSVWMNMAMCPIRAS